MNETALHECEECGCEYEDHVLEMAPHRCQECIDARLREDDEPDGPSPWAR